MARSVVQGPDVRVAPPGGRPPRPSSPPPRRGARRAPSRRPRGRRSSIRSSRWLCECTCSAALPRARSTWASASRTSACSDLDERRPGAPSRSAPARARWMARWAAVNSAVVQSLWRRSEYAASARRTSSRSGSAGLGPAAHAGRLDHGPGPAHVAHLVRVEPAYLGALVGHPVGETLGDQACRAPRARWTGRRRGRRRAPPRAAAYRARARPRTASAAAPRPPGRPWRRARG